MFVTGCRTPTVNGTQPKPRSRKNNPPSPWILETYPLAGATSSPVQHHNELMVPYGQPVPARPVSPGKDDAGKDLNYRQGFRVPVAGNAIGGVRELAGNSAALINGMNELHSAYEADPRAAMGQIPVVKMTDTIAVKTGQSTNFQPIFTIISYVDRPDLLGPRTVPAPRAQAPVAPPVAPPVVNGHPGYTAAANGVPPQAARQAAALPEKVKVMADPMPF